MNGWEKASKLYVVTGRVQGVGYRAFTARAARSLQLSGGASNMPDGSVRVVVTGPLHALDRFEALLWEGPRFARVDKVMVSEPGVEEFSPSLYDVEF
ncbi:MAG: acylphosphatase [Acidobacteria bacterium]|nr:acylphosphatase [Acidobacteriota bacterium]MCG3193299.1 Acylphosphatase [Thermoanaerobaculia bacterium]